MRSQANCADSAHLDARQIRDQWEERGETYADQGMSQSYREMYVDLAGRIAAQQPQAVLEYGCGHAYLLSKISERNDNPETSYYGIDFSESQIKRAKQEFPRAELRVVDLVNDLHTFKSESFDIITGVSVLMYIQKDDIKKVLSELRRLCKGRLYLVENYHKYLNQELQSAYEAVGTDDGRVIHDYESLLIEAGFEKVTTEFFPSFEEDRNQQNEMPQHLVLAS